MCEERRRTCSRRKRRGAAAEREGNTERRKDRETSRNIQADTYTQTHTSRLVEPETLRDRQAHLRLCERLQHVVPESVVGFNT